ncbi:hypothetical protein PPACK8108_LOCUS1304 [Phakopsora pachyrhizi]|uniref:Uncharacterized protein n=1 Tax=Phakopsora pachyrhizi TaxID=170000 RepID=A0AAV0AFM8_PHAPC|nr:hypothetical protein PPACK8108_LOCUS1304 [Phakopsora pachyrhizi]
MDWLRLRKKKESLPGEANPQPTLRKSKGESKVEKLDNNSCASEASAKGKEGWEREEMIEQWIGRLSLFSTVATKQIMRYLKREKIQEEEEEEFKRMQEYGRIPVMKQPDGVRTPNKRREEGNLAPMRIWLNTTEIFCRTNGGTDPLTLHQKDDRNEAAPGNSFGGKSTFLMDVERQVHLGGIPSAPVGQLEQKHVFGMMSAQI